MKKVIVTVVWLVLIFVLVGTASADNPPWPATVFNHLELGDCFINWLAPDLVTFVVVPGQGVSVYQEKTGNWSGFCNAYVDFDDEDFATLSDVCDHPVWGQFCLGNGSAILRGNECYLPALGLKPYCSLLVNGAVLLRLPMESVALSLGQALTTGITTT